MPLCVEDHVTENEGHYTSTLLENVNALHALPMSKTALSEGNYFTVNELRAEFASTTACFPATTNLPRHPLNTGLKLRLARELMPHHSQHFPTDLLMPEIVLPEIT